MLKSRSSPLLVPFARIPRSEECQKLFGTFMLIIPFLITNNKLIIAACEKIFHPSRHSSRDFFEKTKKITSDILLRSKHFRTSLCRFSQQPKRLLWTQRKPCRRQVVCGIVSSYYRLLNSIFDFKQNRESLIFIEKRKPTDDKVFGTERVGCHKRKVL